MDMSWVPSGYDQETAFRIEIKIDGFLRQVDGRKEYVKARTLNWVVDSDRFSLCELINDLSEEISWVIGQIPKIWMFDKNEGRDVAVSCESQILDMFKMYQKEKKITLHVLVCNSDGSSQGSNTAPSHPCTTTLGSQSQFGSSQGHDDCNERVGLYIEELFADDEQVVGREKNVAAQQYEDDLTGEPRVTDVVALEKPFIVYDHENPTIELNALYPNADAFRKALRQFAIKNEFEIRTVKSDKQRFIGKCKNPDCPWRIHASVVRETGTFKVKRLPDEHACPSTTMVDGKIASQSWVSDRSSPWLQKHPTAGAMAVKNKLEDEYHIKVNYSKAWRGRKSALDAIHGSWEDSFQLLYNFKAELEMKYPGSLVEIDVKEEGNKVYFNRIFVALKPCIDGFLQGCRPYVGIDSTHLTGKFKGQLACAAGIDGIPLLFPVAYGIFDLETKDNWTWFMCQLGKAIGNPLGLVISSDAGKGLASAITTIFPNAEHRECMKHLMDNFKKRFQGDVFEENMWPAAYAYTVDKCQFHMANIEAKSEPAIAYLKTYHKGIWKRSEFNKLSKCDYVTNNISESFNSWIKDLKDLNPVDLLDLIRQRIMVMFDKRRKCGSKFQGVILPSVMKEFNARSRSNAKISITRCGDNSAEVNGRDLNGNVYRYGVELDRRECACGEWQLTGVPCIHACHFICSIRGTRLEDYVHEYYSLDKFRSAYACSWRPMNGKSQWPKVDPGFKVLPPQSKRPPGRPKKQRIPGCLEKSKGCKRQQCKRCLQYGHQQRTCKEPIPENSEAAPSIKKRKRGTRKA